MSSKGPIYKGIQAINELFLVNKFGSSTSQKLLLQVFMLACSYPSEMLAKKIGQKIYVDRAQVDEQVAAAIEKNATSENAG